MQTKYEGSSVEIVVVVLLDGPMLYYLRPVLCTKCNTIVTHKCSYNFSMARVGVV